MRHSAWMNEQKLELLTSLYSHIIPNSTELHVVLVNKRHDDKLHVQTFLKGNVVNNTILW